MTIILNFSLEISTCWLRGKELCNPGFQVQVPLRLVINLKQRQKCYLLLPECMYWQKLVKIRDHGRMKKMLPLLLTKLLLNHASDNIPKAEQGSVGHSHGKLQGSACSFVRQQEAHAKMDYLTLVEVHTSGPCPTKMLNHMCTLCTHLHLQCLTVPRLRTLVCRGLCLLAGGLRGGM